MDAHASPSINPQAIGAGVALFAAACLLAAVHSPAGADEYTWQVPEAGPSGTALPVSGDDLTRWEIEVSNSVSTEPLRMSTVQKIEYGRLSIVRVVETATGVYSNDALTNPHIRYPGIDVRERQLHQPGIAIWDGRDWVSIAPVSARSFVSLVSLDDGQSITVREGN